MIVAPIASSAGSPVKEAAMTALKTCVIALGALAAGPVLNAVPAYAGPCTADIAAFEGQVRQSGNKPDAGPYLSQSVGAQMSRQPTPDSVKRAEAQAQTAFDAAMARAKQLDARADGAGCTRALSAAKQRYNLQ
ncbi:MAG TPA: hypothetical protein VGJ01_10730 [Pseudolabrys sp.]